MLCVLLQLKKKTLTPLVSKRLIKLHLFDLLKTGWSKLLTPPFKPINIACKVVFYKSLFASTSNIYNYNATSLKKNTPLNHFFQVMA